MFAKRPETEVWLSGKPSCLLEPSSSSSSVTTLLRTTPRLELNEALLVSIRTRVTLIVSEYNRAFDASLNEPRADARTFFIVLFILVFALMELLALHSIKQKTLWDIGSDVLFSSFVAIVAAAYFTAKIYVDEASVPIETGETIRDSPTRMGANAGKRRGARPIDLTPAGSFVLVAPVGSLSIRNGTGLSHTPDTGDARNCGDQRTACVHHSCRVDEREMYIKRSESRLFIPFLLIVKKREPTPNHTENVGL